MYHNPFQPTLRPCYWLVPLLALALYWSALDNGFLAWDDNQYVTANPHIQSLTWANLAWMFSHFHFANWHPLTWLSHAVDYAMWGARPWGHHLTNIVLHSLNTFLFILLSQRLFHHLSTTHRMAVAAERPAVWLAGLLFAVHPLHVEVVAWVSERKELLAFAFSMMSLLAYWDFIESRRWRPYLLALLAFSAALMSKPMAITLPLVFFILEIFPLGQWGAQERRWNFMVLARSVRDKIPFFLLSAGSALLSVLAQAHSGAIIDMETLSLTARLLNATHSILLYFSKFLIPIGLIPFYPFPAHYGESLDVATAAALAALLFALGAAVAAAWRYRQLGWLAALAFYLITLLPVLGILQVGSQAAADRYTYLPTLPFYWLTAAGIGALWAAAPTRRWLVIILSSAWLAILAGQTHAQIAVWRNDITLWTQALVYTPHSSLAHSNLAGALMREGKYAQAIPHYRAAMQTSIKPGDYYFLAIAYLNTGQLPQARQVYEQMLDMGLNAGPGQATVYANLATLYADLGELDKANTALAQALALHPSHPGALALRARLGANPQP